MKYRAYYAQIHINDLTSSFLFLLDLALTKPTTYPRIKTGWETFHSVEIPSESLPWSNISTIIGNTLHKLGKIETPGARSVVYTTDTGMDNGVLSDCARSKGDRLESLGWRGKEKSLEETLERDVEDVLENMGLL
jgi:hypothetical protein